MDRETGNRWKTSPEGMLSPDSSLSQHHLGEAVRDVESSSPGLSTGVVEPRSNPKEPGAITPPVPLPQSGNGSFEPALRPRQIEDQAASETRTSIPGLILANSYVFSLIIHLTMLILLSLVSYSLHQGTELELQLASSPADDPIVMIESDDSNASEGNDMDEEMEQLLAASAESASFEVNAESFDFDPQMSLENLDGQDDSTSDSTESLIKSERKVGNGNQAKFFGIQATGKNFVFIVDSSGSMTGARWKNAVRELQNSLESLQENQRFYVIFFDHQTHLMFQGRVDRFRRSRSLKMVHATEDNLTRVNKWLRRVDLGKRTRPRVSFDYGLALNPDAIFFLTDGEFNDGTYEYLMGFAAQNSTLPTIHTVAFGNEFAGKALEEIADKFRGKYRFVR